MSITNNQRLLVSERANNCCEYCRVAQAGRLSTFHVDHIIALKHDGTDDSDNLCLACYKCNRLIREKINPAEIFEIDEAFIQHFLSTDD